MAAKVSEAHLTASKEPGSAALAEMVTPPFLPPQNHLGVAEEPRGAGWLCSASRPPCSLDAVPPDDNRNTAHRGQGCQEQLN